MKKDLRDILSELEAPETGRLTRGLVEELDPAAKRRIAEKALASCPTAGERSSKRRPRLSRRAYAVIAACLALLIALGVGTYAYADAAEYRQALIFFENNDISTEGLTRNEIKKVYRDITTESYTYSKTAEVLAHNKETHTVEGGSFGPEATQLTDNERQAGYEKSYERYLSSARYEFDTDRDYNEGDGSYAVSFRSSTVKKMVGTSEVWSVTTDKLDAHFAFEVSDGVIISGWLPYEYSGELEQEADIESHYIPAVMKLDNSGSFVWICAVGGDNVSSAVENADGTYTVFSSENDPVDVHSAKLFVSRIDAEGNLAGSVETSSDAHVWVCDVVPCEGGYLGINYVDDYTGTHEQHVVRIDAEGRLTEEFKFGEGDAAYRLFDIKVFGGRLYISAGVKGDAYEAYYGDGEWWKKNVSKEEFTEAAKNAYTAVLLVCDTVDSEPRLFYEVKGAAGWGLTVDNEGRLVWEVHSIYEASFMPMLNSRPFAANAKVYDYLFSEDGAFINAVDTGEVVTFTPKEQ